MNNLLVKYLNSFFYLICIALLFTACDLDGAVNNEGDQQTTTTPSNEITIPAKNNYPYVVNGKVIKILDGDTYDVLTDDRETIRVRMDGIDAPEGGMPYYKVSKDYLSHMAFKQQVRVEVEEKDAFGRYIAKTYLPDGRELGAEMLKAGMAWFYREYNHETALEALERDARENHLGLWKENNPVPPWIIRRLRRRGISTKTLSVFREKTIELTQNDTTFREKNWLFKITEDGTSLDIYQNDAKTQTISEINTLDGVNTRFLSVADYNMDGHPDLLFRDDDDHVAYYLYDSISNKFRYHKAWQQRVWKQDRANRKFLTIPEGTVYSGSVSYFEIHDDVPQQVVKVEYYK